MGLSLETGLKITFFFFFFKGLNLFSESVGVLLNLLSASEKENSLRTPSKFSFFLSIDTLQSWSQSLKDSVLFLC